MDIITDLNKFVDRANEIDLEEDRKLISQIIDEMQATMEERNLQFLTAPQIGYPYRIICIGFKTKNSKLNIKHYINPIINNTKGFTLTRQKDASLPNREFIHPRSPEISMMYQTLATGSLGSVFKGVTAFILQQCVDLLDGMTLETIGLEIDSRFDEATEEEKNELLEAYVKSVTEYKEQLEKEIKEDPDLTAINNAANFMSKVGTGEVKVKKDLTVERPETK